MTMHTTKPLVIEFLGTPEAGKTSLIHRLSPELMKHHETRILQESAEIVPPGFVKGSLEEHYWMRLHTATNILENQASSPPGSILLVDRGIIDTLFWDYLFLNSGKLTTKQSETSTNFFTNLGINPPDMVVWLTTTPEESIRRRGGEGRLVTLDFIKNFNCHLNTFMNNVSVPKFHLDSTGLTEETVFSIVLEKILGSIV